MDNRTVWAPIFFGGLWGIAEATVGHMLHLASRVTVLPGLAGFFMFPIGFFFMMSCYKKTHAASSVILTAAVAAGIKASSVIHPAVTLLFVSNPVISILAEGLVVFLVAPALVRFRFTQLLPLAFSVSAGWRLLFFGLVFILPVQKGILMKGPVAILSFLLFESIINSVLLLAIIAGRAEERTLLRLRRFTSTAVFAVIAVCIGVGVELVLLGL